MKFGKSYMETLASPSFPKEWRDGAIEYKQLKKLINGVVAELESLGLGADVLRDLMVPPEAAERKSKKGEEGVGGATVEESDDEMIENLIDLDVSKTDSNEAEVRRRHREHLPGVDPHSSSYEDATGSSADDCEMCTQSFLRHKADQGSDSSSAAVEWVSSISHAQHSSKKGRRRSSRPSNSASKKEVVGGIGSYDDQLQVPASAFVADDESDGDNVEILQPLFRSTTRDRSNDATSSAEEGGLKPFNGIGKKDLEALRRASSVGRTEASKDMSGHTTVDGAHHSTSSSATQEADRIRDWGGHNWRERAQLNPPTPVNTETAKLGEKGKGKWVQGKGGRRARAEYELGGTKEHPIPRIRLFVESPINSDDEVTAGDEADSEGGSEDELDGKMDDEDEDDRIEELPDVNSTSPTPTLRPLLGQARSPVIRANDKGAHREMRQREIIIPLTADTEFLDTLTGALANLSTLQSSQREHFIESTESLCKSVARVSSPYATKNDLYVWREIFSLWCEFQIFESQREKDRGELSVDESEARLKRFAAEMAKRGWTAEAFGHDGDRKRNGGRLAKMMRHKGDATQTSGLPMKDRQSVQALEDFLKLNLALLDVKKFQRVNVEAARKILKKHDKRTALTASSDFQHFLAEQESARVNATAATAAGFGISGLINVPPSSFGDASNASSAMVLNHGATHPSLAALLPHSTTALLSESLPHILLSLLTTTLLPILPSIDDYSCAICTGVAWRPIQLDCSHLFCIRCLVKLQKRGKSDCPLCRAKGVVDTADGKNMDDATVKFIKAWFPKEVTEKEQENESDRRKEELQELGLALDAEKCIIA
ncbi:hypothetical protein CBS101457_002405 [Exobasidium rhododendri]|nr:hypothetical protein CBS101457_002405 [Exobasidium rhododendri]